jgi:hypothetical protein
VTAQDLSMSQPEFEFLVPATGMAMLSGIPITKTPKQRRQQQVTLNNRWCCSPLHSGWDFWSQMNVVSEEVVCSYSFKKHKFGSANFNRFANDCICPGTGNLILSVIAHWRAVVSHVYQCAPWS